MIAQLERAVTEAPEGRDAQRALAREVTRLVHGDAAVTEAEAATKALFTSDINALTAKQVAQTMAGVPSATIARTPEGWPVVELLTAAGVTKSKSEATRLIRGGGVYINDRRVTDEKARVTAEQAIEGQLFVIRKGKRDNFLVHIR